MYSHCFIYKFNWKNVYIIETVLCCLYFYLLAYTNLSTDSLILDNNICLTRK